MALKHHTYVNELFMSFGKPQQVLKQPINGSVSNEILRDVTPAQYQTNSEMRIKRDNKLKAMKQTNESRKQAKMETREEPERKREMKENLVERARVEEEQNP